MLMQFCLSLFLIMILVTNSSLGPHVTHGDKRNDGNSNAWKCTSAAGHTHGVVIRGVAPAFAEHVVALLVCVKLPAGELRVCDVIGQRVAALLRQARPSEPQQTTL